MKPLPSMDLLGSSISPSLAVGIGQRSVVNSLAFFPTLMLRIERGAAAAKAQSEPGNKAEELAQRLRAKGFSAEVQEAIEPIVILRPDGEVAAWIA